MFKEYNIDFWLKGFKGYILHSWENMQMYPTFISDLISLDIMVLAIFIPIGYNAVSRALNNYGNQAAQYFQKKWSIRWIIWVVLIHLIVSLFYNSLQSPDNTIEYPWFALTIVIMTIATWVIIGNAAFETYRFGINRKYVRTQFISNLETAFSKNNTNDFYTTVNGYGEFLQSIMLKNEHVLVKKGLEDFEKYFRKIINIREVDYNRFNQYVFSKELLEESDSDKRDYLLFYDRSGLPIINLIEQIQNIFNSSADKKIGEINFNAHVTLIRILQMVSSIEGVGILVSKILNSLQDIAITSMKTEGLSTYTSLEWYTSCVFPLSKEKRLQIQYLNDFNRTLNAIIIYSISNGYDSVISSFMDLSHHGLHYFEFDGPQRVVSSTWDLNAGLTGEKHSDLYEIESKLVKTLSIKITKTKYDQFLKDLINVKKKVIEIIGSDNNTVESHLKNLMHSVEDKFKYDEFRVLLNYVLSYCLYKQRVDKVIEFWQYKQPDDADASWTGNQLFDDDIYKFLEFHYDGRDFWHARYEFHEGHHGTLRYINHYLGLRVAYSLRFNHQVDTELPSLPITSVDLLFGLEESASQMLSYLQEEVKNDNSYGIFSEKKTTFDAAIEFINNVTSNIGDCKKAYISQETLIHHKIKDFSDGLLKSFSENRKLLPLLNKLMDGNKIIDRNGKQAITNLISDKAQFIDWRVAYSGFDTNLGQVIAEREDLILFKQLSKKITDKEEIPQELLSDRIEELINKSNGVDLIITNFFFQWDFIQKSKVLRRPEENEFKDFDIDIPFCFQNDGSLIPIIFIRAKSTNSLIMFMNTNNVFEEIQRYSHNSISWELRTTTEKYKMDTNKIIEKCEINSNDNNEKLDVDQVKVSVSISPYYKFPSELVLPSITIVTDNQK